MLLPQSQRLNTHLSSNQSQQLHRHSLMEDDNQEKDITLKPRFSKKTLQIDTDLPIQNLHDQVNITPTNSPRSRFLKRKFSKFDFSEVVLDNFSCAYSSPKLLL